MIKLMVKHGIDVKNMTLDDSNRLQIKEWPNGINVQSTNDCDKESSYILLGKVTEERFKLIDPIRNVIYLDQHRLRHFIMMGAVANCKRMGAENITYKSIDTYSMRKDIKFEALIARKYTEFVAKAALMNMKITFEYTVENEDVKITKYTGDSCRVILPSFVTVVCKGAFQHRGITELKLNNGLKYIGKSAFYGNPIKHVELPKTVAMVWGDSFINLDKGTKKDGLATGIYDTILIN